MIRFLIAVLTLFFYLVVLIPVMLVLLVIRHFNRNLASRIAQGMVRRVFRFILFTSGVQVEVRGLENLPEEGGMLFVSNHRSYFDILTGFGFTPRIFGFVAKAEMLRYPLLKQWMDLVNCLFINRKNVKEGLKTILKGIENVRGGISVWICPEGTRTMTPDPMDIGEFKEGSLKIAEKSGCPIIPVALSGTYEIFEKQFPRIKSSKVILEYGAPIVIDQLGKEEQKKLGSLTRARILAMLREHEAHG